jgi:hypothetical protein
MIRMSSGDSVAPRGYIEDVPAVSLFSPRRETAGYDVPPVALYAVDMPLAGRGVPAS